MTDTARTIDVSGEDPFEDKAFSNWWDAVFTHLGRNLSLCWDEGPMLDVLVEKYKEGLSPEQGAKESYDDYEQGQLEAQMAVPIWDR